MKHCVLLLLVALSWVHVRGAPVETAGLAEGSCDDAFAKSAAKLALEKINEDRQEGYAFALHRLSNAHMAMHGENGVVFYLNVDVVETNCSVLNRKESRQCDPRPTHDTPVYGQCKAAIFISKVHRVVRLYKYNCAVRPVPSGRVAGICPDCPALTSLDSDRVTNTVTLSLDKFNKESGLGNRFALLRVNRATAGMAMSMYYNVEYTIKETTCPRSTENPTAENCPLMDCEFAHTGFCKASNFPSPDGQDQISVDCEIYEPEAAEREKKLHLLGGETDHSHTASATDLTQSHDHHHHSGSGHGHSHGHGHVHAHHAGAHDHSGHPPNHHHNYQHAAGVETHDHDHEHALDHNHKHTHLHDHEHHHHHHDHHEKAAHQPQGSVRMLPALGQPVTLPADSDVPAAGPESGVVLPLKPDPQIPGQQEPTIEAYPTKQSSQCAPALVGATLVEQLFSEDATFKSAA
ncbi:uncharacterized protein V6R79_016112 [Siganus canaliculatus]